MIEKLTGHLKTINRHKALVMSYCFRAGLYKQGLLHDLSKYSPSEFITGVKYYQGNKSPNTAERAEKGYGNTPNYISPTNKTTPISRLVRKCAGNKRYYRSHDSRKLDHKRYRVERRRNFFVNEKVEIHIFHRPSNLPDKPENK